MNIEQHNVQRNNVASEAMPIECYSAADFDDVIECVRFTNDASEEI